MSITIPTPKKGFSRKPPTRAEAKITNLSKKPSKQLVTLNLKVTATFRRDVKLYATSKDTSMASVLKKAFQEYKERHI